VQVEISLYLHFILGRWTEIHHLLWSAGKHLRRLLLRLRMRLRLRGKQLSIDGRIAVGVVVEGITARVGIEDGLGCGRRLELELGLGL
jgi:hypothetical protein